MSTSGPLAEHLGHCEIAGSGHLHGLLRDRRNLVRYRGLRLGFEEGLYLGIDRHVGILHRWWTERVA